MKQLPVFAKGVPRRSATSEYVDIHSHVLYGLDDGANTCEQSVQMLEIAARSGTTDIVATPHANGQYAFDPEMIEQDDLTTITLSYTMYPVREPRPAAQGEPGRS